MKTRLKKIRTVFLISIVTLVLAVVQTSCKKTKFTGEYSGMAGNWEWVSGWPDSGNTNFKLELLEKGKYKLYNGSYKIDAGRLIEKNGGLFFKSNKLFDKGYFSEYHEILLVKNDTLYIGSHRISDFPSSAYARR
jgi:hypothetical protein